MVEHVLTPYPGFSREVGLYLSGMEEVREQVSEAVGQLSIEQIGVPAFKGAHSIGALVLHIGEAEWWWIQCIVSGHELTDADRQAPFWDVLEDPEGFSTKRYTAEFCLKQIRAIRRQTKEFLSVQSDADLDRMYVREKNGLQHEHNLRWILHHLIDHEAQHKGQILMLKRLLLTRA